MNDHPHTQTSPTLSAASSWWITALLVFAMLVLYLAGAFGDNPYQRWIHLLFRTPVGISCYLALCLNITLASVRVAMRRIRPADPTVDSVKAMDAWRLSTDRHAEEQLFRKRAATAGYHIRESAHALVASRGRWSFLPGTVLRLGIVLTMLAVFASVHLRQTADATVERGGASTLMGLPITVDSIDAPLQADYLAVGDDTAFSLDHVSATLRIADASRTISSGLPVTISGRQFRIVRFGYAQPLTFRDGNDAHRMSFQLDLLPPGRSQNIAFAPTGTGAIISLAPDKVINKGLLKGKQYNLVRPRYRIEMHRPADAAPAPYELVAGETTSDGRISAEASSLYVTIHAVSDPAYLVIVIGVMTMLTGLLVMPSRFFWYLKEEILLRNDQQIYLGCSEEFFKKWAIARFHEREQSV